MFTSRKRLKSFEEEAIPHLAALFKAARGMSSDSAAAEDLVQETYRQAWASYHRYAPGTDCKAWLFRILFRVRSNRRKESRRFEWVEIDEVPETLFSSRPDAVLRLEGKEVVETIESLPEHYRIVLLLADAEELSYHEIAEILELPIGTVMSRLNRGRRLFRRKFLTLAARVETA